MLICRSAKQGTALLLEVYMYMYVTGDIAFVVILEPSKAAEKQSGTLPVFLLRHNKERPYLMPSVFTPRFVPSILQPACPSDRTASLQSLSDSLRAGY